MDININLHTALGNVNFKKVDKNYTEKTTHEENVFNLFLLMGMGLPWKTFDLFCEKLNLTPEQIELFRKQNTETWHTYLDNNLNKKNQRGWEG
jgi:hypothetical protein